MKYIAPDGFWTRRGLPDPVVEHPFFDGRRWKFDFAWIDKKIALEVEGGTWMARGFGGHNRGSGMARDMAKYNHATRLGWRIYRVTPQHLADNLPIDDYPKNYKGKRETTIDFLKGLLNGEV